MIIPHPRFSPIAVDYSKFGFFGKIREAWRNPPKFVLVDDWIITLDDGLQLIFLKGFVTDFASVPRVFWLIPGFTPYGPLLYGSIPHDFGYQHGYFLTPYNKTYPYPVASKLARIKFPALFEKNIPIFIGRDREFFDGTMEGICEEVSGKTFVASVAHAVLKMFGGVVWSRYRERGPGAYNDNSLGLPGVNDNGEVVA